LIYIDFKIHDFKNIILEFGSKEMSYSECLPLVKQLNHSEKLKLAQWLIQVIAQEEGIFADETDYVLNNPILMAQIELSESTHQQGYQPTTEELDEILSV
jgi:hypothetical protein